MKPANVKRREFLAAAAAVPLILPQTVFGANKKLNIGFIGMGGVMGGSVESALDLKHNVVAFCDVDPNQISRSKKKHGEAVANVKEYGDYRKMLDKEKSLDAVVIATTDHWHAPISTAAIHAGLHVYCQKPLTHTVAEARELGDLSRNAKVVTQMGNQGSATSSLRRSIELIQAGFFGQISNVHVWHPGPPRYSHGVPRPKGAGPVPNGMNWDFWCGPAPLRPYTNEIYHPGNWRGWYDFGNGKMGDFCCHSFNLPVRALKLDYPTRVEISGVKNGGLESYASAVTYTLRFPAKDGRSAVNIIYYMGDQDRPPKALVNHLKGTFGGIRNYVLLEGEKGLLSTGMWGKICYVKMDGDKKFISHGKHPEARKIAQSLPRVDSHFGEWTDAILDGGETFSPFEVGGHLTEIGLVGNVALRLQKNLDWDGEAMKAKGMPEADALIRKQNRTKWL